MLNRESLLRLLDCMMVVCYVDGMDEGEMAFIERVMGSVWEYGEAELSQAIIAASTEAAKRHATHDLEALFDASARHLATSLDPKMKGAAQSLMMQLIKADQRITGDETRLFIRFKQLLAGG